MKRLSAQMDRRMVGNGLSAAFALLAILGAATTARGQCQTGHFFAVDGEPSELFGYAVAISGDTAIVSANDDVAQSGIITGSAYIYVRTANGWMQQAQLFASDGAAGDQFGYSVAIDGNTAVVGADWDNTPAGTHAGSAYVFVRTGTTWTQQAKLVANNASPNDILGVSIGVSGDTVVVGAPGDNTAAGNDAGSAYVFVRTGTVWTQQAQLFAFDAAPGDFFSGYSLAIDGNSVVIGAYADNTDAGTDAGSAYVFVRDGNGVWSEQAHLFASDGATNDGFGNSVSISGDAIIVGSSGIYPPNGTNAGSAYVFFRDEDVWTEQQILVSPNPSGMEHFGWSVAISGETALIGAPFDPQLGGGPDIGSAYTFFRSGGVWTLNAHLEPSDGAAGDIFGFAVAIDGNTAFVSADYDDTVAAVDAGSAYVFNLACGDLNCDNAVNMADVPHFIEALLATGNFTGCDINRADMNQDGVTNGRDTKQFMDALLAS